MSDLSAEVVWFAIAVLLGVAEIFTVSFFALVLAAGAAGAALSAWAGVGLVTQLMVAGLVSLTGLLLLWRWRQSRAGSYSADPSMAADWLDHDHVIIVPRSQWSARGVTRVQYRGAAWDAVLEAGHLPPEGIDAFRIVRFSGNQLVLSPISSSPLVPHSD